ncbi:MAG: 3',5'-cyclic-AMP phosphodiesterase [Methyloglobulus sp.]|nr:3',5'-cyclic-AMP phosphodiesterase [Methyloglobulus sp.]
MHETSNHLSILQITDPHILSTSEATLLGVNTAYYFNAVIEYAFSSGRHFDICLITGDLAQDPCTASYEHILDRLQPHNIPCLCLPGNHDDFEIMQTVLCTERVNCRKKIALGNWQIINLNSQIPRSADGYLSVEELAFLERSLRDSPDFYTLIAVHHHCLPSGSHWMDTMMIKNAEDLFDLIKRHPNVKAIINGHIHQATDIQIDGLRILSTPSTCFQFKPQSEHFSLDDKSPGYRWINLSVDGSISTDIVRIPERLTGLQIDTEGY